MNMIRRILCRLRGHDPRLVHSGVYRCARCRQVWAIQRRDVTCEADDAIKTQLPHPDAGNCRQDARCQMAVKNNKKRGLWARAIKEMGEFADAAKQESNPNPQDNRYDQLRRISMGRRDGMSAISTGPLANRDGKRDEVRSGDWCEEQRA